MNTDLMVALIAFVLWIALTLDAYGAYPHIFHDEDDEDDE